MNNLATVENGALQRDDNRFANEVERRFLDAAIAGVLPENFSEVFIGKDTEKRCPLVHAFADGIYYREIFMPAGTFVVGFEHATQHFNIVLEGQAIVVMEDKAVRLVAPNSFVSEAGVRKTLFIEEDMRWITIHPNPDNCRDIGALESRLRVKSQALLDYESAMKTLTAPTKEEA